MLVCLFFFGHGTQPNVAKINETKSGIVARCRQRSTVAVRFSQGNVKPFIIFNPAAGSVMDQQRTLAELNRLRPTALMATRKRGDAEKLSRRAVRRGCGYLVVAGGDGTLNEVVNGIASTRRPPKIGILPLGTGNDFARALGLPISLEENIDILRTGKTRAIDIVRVRSDRAR